MPFNRRRNWPDTRHTMAVERIAIGAKITEIATEAGTHKSLIANGSGIPNPPAWQSRQDRQAFTYAVRCRQVGFL